ncbi:hypothetical protein HJC06_23515 [Rhizobium sp. NLR9b]|uniref:hypothetical protein n=1 Tax=unclassified Rhizobium TaxID=2613769 RepID=UPI001C83A27E|nr:MULTISPECIES: hypothetical protein [unclassified Rhizobium]MBX5229349.1 hypothetical protein [Rhizobium sp. NLR9b]MBX5290276.1 hypothetical protein [Rhizobium sp. NLR10b]
MDKRAKISTGTNDRPRNETIAESGPGIPDDSGRMVEVPDAEARRMKASLLRDRLDKLKEKLDEETELPQRGAP